LFGDGMVLQRNRAVAVWGTADADQQITVTFGDQKHTTTADASNRWRVMLDAMPASAEGRTLTITGDGATIEHEDVLVGEVWIGSGQSNMEWPMHRSDAEAEIAAAGDPHLRLFTVKRAVAHQPRTDVEGSWQGTSPQSVRNFSAVGYFFALKLREELDVPVGMVISAWGGTPAEAWAPRDRLEAEPRLTPLLARWDQRVENNADAANHQHRPANLYNAMIAPLTPMTFRGAIWYQGESNVGRAYQYRTIFPLMIESWRERFAQGDFPFYYAQIAPFNYNSNPAFAAELWEAQLLTMRMLPNTGMAVLTDIGDVSDIHPTNKVDVGDRLAAWALAKTYNLDVPYSGPVYTHQAIEDGAIRLHFDHAQGMKSADGEPLSHFTIAGADGEFHAATAEVDGATVVVRSGSVPHPIAVRFAWHDSAEPNFVNASGLPASPFRTDSFPLLTRDSH
ncbi:MAG: sialate O-acetylesterase, partial [Phycisphaeraceae bacterium]